MLINKFQEEALLKHARFLVKIKSTDQDLRLRIRSTIKNFSRGEDLGNQLVLFELNQILRLFDFSRLEMNNCAKLKYSNEMIVETTKLFGRVLAMSPEIKVLTLRLHEKLQKSKFISSLYNGLKKVQSIRELRLHGFLSLCAVPVDYFEQIAHIDIKKLYLSDMENIPDAFYAYLRTSQLEALEIGSDIEVLSAGSLFRHVKYMAALRVSLSLFCQCLCLLDTESGSSTHS